MKKAMSTGEPFDIKKLSKLANLTLRKDEKEKFAKQFAEILIYFEKIRALKTENTEFISQITGLENIARDDNATACLSQEEVLSNTKSKHNGLFKVKAILNE